MYEYRLQRKEKYAKKDLFELLTNTVFGDIPWITQAAEDFGCAEVEFKRCEELYSKILEDMNAKLMKGERILLGSRGNWNYYYSHKDGCSYMYKGEIGGGD